LIGGTRTKTKTLDTVEKDNIRLGTFIIKTDIPEFVGKGSKMACQFVNGVLKLNFT
jgi:hypothetical protein